MNNMEVIYFIDLFINLAQEQPQRSLSILPCLWLFRGKKNKLFFQFFLCLFVPFSVDVLSCGSTLLSNIIFSLLNTKIVKFRWLL